MNLWNAQGGSEPPARNRWRQLARWAPALVAALVATTAILLVVHWQRQSDQSRSEQLVLVQVEAAANHQSTLEWQAIADGSTGEEVVTGTREVTAYLKAKLAELRRLDPQDDTTTRQIPLLLGRYQRAVMREFALLDAGRLRAAHQIDMHSVDPAFQRLTTLLDLATARHGREAATERRSATEGSAIAVGLALLLIGLLLWRFVRSGRKLVALHAEEAGVRRSEQEFRALAQNASDLVSVIDPEARIIYQSDSSLPILGYSPLALAGRRVTELVHPEDLPRVVALLATDDAADDLHARFECRIRHRDGHWVHVETLVSRLTSAAENEHRLVLTSRDIGDRKALEEQLRHQAFHDALTGLPNRALFEDRVGHALAGARRASALVAVLFADLDDFKLINDSLGHAAGDDLLRVVAQRLRACVREEDTAARLGGDEFAVLLTGDVNVEAAEQTAARILEALAAPVSIMDRQVVPRISIGIALSDADTRDTTALMRSADVAMYAAKASGKGDVALFDSAMYTTAVRRFELSDDLDQALRENQFELRYQPIVTLETESIAGVEALLRWNHPRDGMLAPLDFIPIAEETGAIVPIGRWVLREACRQAGIWERDRTTGAPLHICVNLSARQLADPDLVSDVRDALQVGGLSPAQLVLEVTESVLVDDVEATASRLEELKALGVRLAVDDFGTGYSALSYLQNFPFDILKIDKSFIDGLQHGTDQSNVVQALIELGGSLHLDVVAEGIEQPDQLAALRTMNSEFGQGYLFARPLEAGALTELLAAQAESRGSGLTVS